MGTKNNPGSYDCYTKADPDEPMFVLLARDKHALALVWLWTVLRELDGEEKAVVDEARECADAMMRWAADNNRKVAGTGQAVLAGVFELIRVANYAVRNAENEPTSNADAMRFFLALTEFANGPEKAAAPA